MAEPISPGGALIGQRIGEVLQVHQLQVDGTFKLLAAHHAEPNQSAPADEMGREEVQIQKGPL